jgi:predicted ArsR family transcriptional regulator
MQSSVHPGDREFLTDMLRCGQATISDLCQKTGVTATAVRQRLQRLQAAGLVERRSVRTDRGRPHHLYDVTAAGRRELGQNYAELAILLWDELRQIEDEPLRRRVLARVEQAMVDQFRRRVTGDSPQLRMKQLATVLSERGFPIEMDQPQADGLPVLREHSCPYHEIASQDSSICELEQAVFAQVVGSPLELTQCCQRGDRVCEFEPASRGSSENRGNALSGGRV